MIRLIFGASVEVSARQEYSKTYNDYIYLWELV